MIQTKNFKLTTDPKLVCTCGHTMCDKRSVNQETLDKLQLVREWYGKPILVTSGGRCPYHSSEQHRTKPADHQKGIGVDVFYDGIIERNLLMMYAIKAGFTAVAVGGSFIHMGNRPQQHLTTWEY